MAMVKYISRSLVSVVVLELYELSGLSSINLSNHLSPPGSSSLIYPFTPRFRHLMRFPSLFACCLGDTGHPARPCTRGPRGAERAPLAESAAQFEFIGELCRDSQAEKSRVFLSLCTGDSQCSQLFKQRWLTLFTNYNLLKKGIDRLAVTVYLSTHPTGSHPTDLSHRHCWPSHRQTHSPPPTGLFYAISHPNCQTHIPSQSTGK